MPNRAVPCHAVLCAAQPDARGGPLPLPHHPQVLQKVADPTLDPPFRPLLEPATTPPQVRDLCSRCWLADPAGRPTFQQLSVELRLMNVSDINTSMKALHVRFPLSASAARRVLSTPTPPPVF